MKSKLLNELPAEHTSKPFEYNIVATARRLTFRGTATHIWTGFTPSSCIKCLDIGWVLGSSRASGEIQKPLKGRSELQWNQLLPEDVCLSPLTYSKL